MISSGTPATLLYCTRLRCSVESKISGRTVALFARMVASASSWVSQSIQLTASGRCSWYCPAIPSSAHVASETTMILKTLLGSFSQPGSAAGQRVPVIAAAITLVSSSLS